MSDILSANIRELCIGPDEPIRGVLRILEASHREIVLVVSGEGQLLGTVTDGDVRRGLLAGQALDAPLALIMSRQPIV
ncbi:MAG: CBS domain-containing protein, partial [Candidatus Latescibacteria bacterium]|nr:CBS domain-containing protein [Candidatus Latescibacterota bacterium]